MLVAVAALALLTVAAILLLLLRIQRVRQTSAALEDAHQTSEAKTFALLEAIPDLMFVQDRDGRYVDFYAPAGSRLYTSPETFLGKRFVDVLPPEATAVLAPGFERVVRTGEPATFEYRLTMPGGVAFYEARLVRLAPDKVLSIVRDVTARRQAELALEESRRFTERLTHTVPNIVFVYDLNERRNTYVNDRSESVLGYTAREVIEMGDQFLPLTLHPDDVRELPRLAQQYAMAKDGEVLTHNFRFRHKNGDWVWISRSATVFARDAEGRPTQVLGSGIDVTGLKRAEEELRSLSARLRDSQDEERRRIARDLHDGVAQSVFGIGALITRTRQHLGVNDDASATLAECARLCDECLKELRLMSYVLHPPLLEAVGLAPAVRWFTDGLARRSGIRIEVEAEDTVERFPPTIERDLFRIVQEGLNNVIRHSGSTKALVRLNRRNGCAVLRIQDFGHGMPTGGTLRADGEGPPRGVGILGIRERLRHVGGRLEIESGADGTTLTATIPLSETVGV
jgi:PAS domain S-box-containing protein